MKLYLNQFSVLLLFSLLGCSSSKLVKEPNPVQVSHVYFQDWTTDIKIGSSGTNIFLANLTTKKGVEADSIFFRNLKGKLVKGRSVYYSQLLRMLPNSQDNKLMTVDYPFNLGSHECMVSYIQNNETKYIKIDNVQEREGVHYLEGPPEKL